jgi:hypothetical protein
VNAFRTLGYEAVWQGERSWNGVGILARNHVPVLTCTSLPGNSEGHFFETRNLEDRQARYIEAAVQGVLITSIYLPNGNPQPGPKFNYKLAWFEPMAPARVPLQVCRGSCGLAWDVTDRGFYYYDGMSSGREILFFDFATKRTRAVARTPGRPDPFSHNISVSPDEKDILYTQMGHSTADIVLAEGFH